MDIKREQLEKKLLGEDCWIDLGDNEKLKIDYWTESQEAELRRLNRIVQLGIMGEYEHPDHFLLRCTIKAVEGITIDGKPIVLKFKSGMIERTDDPTEDISNILKTAGKYDTAVMLINMKLFYGPTDKKKQKSQQDSSGRANLKNAKTSQT